LSAVAVNLSGKLTLAAGTTGSASENIPAGVAPTSPNNGDIWTTATGLFVRAGGVTIGPVIGLAQQSATSPLVYNSGTGQESCPTCATTTNGGSLSATVPVAIAATGLITCTTCATTTNGGGLTAIAPMSISAAGSIALASTQRYAEFVWDSQASVHNDTYPVAIKMPSTGGGTIQNLTYYTNGTTSPAFTIGLQVAGTPVVGTCSSILVGTGGNGVGTTTTTTCAPTTTLAAAITTTGQTSISVTSNSGFPASGNFVITIDSEQMTVTAGQGTNNWTVTRGSNSTVAATHLNNATVTGPSGIAFTANQRVDLVITGTAGVPSSAAVQVNYLMAPT
jgi:hypothetical protein